MQGNNRIKLGLALSGGGARGLAHIGVLRALEKANIQLDYLTGTSMGGVIAAAYASGLSPDEIEQIALKYASVRKLWGLADPTLPRRGLLQGERLLAFFEKHMHGCTFADLRVPLTLIAVDLNSRQEVHLREGSVAEAVRATVSIPGLLAPAERNGQRLVDGGLLNNLPVDVVQSMGADVTLGVDVYSNNGGPSFWQELGQTRVLSQTIGDLIMVLGDSLDLLIQQQSLNKLQNNSPDFLIYPDIPVDVTVVTGFHRAADLITLGEEATTAILPDLQASLMAIKQI
ncbi:MAG: patatin-like phospholipase family protein [Anaerolineales bacterium]|nr:patatin-like phospholipase family protein [Anaerolineales bacterium]